MLCTTSYYVLDSSRDRKKEVKILQADEMQMKAGAMASRKGRYKRSQQGKSEPVPPSNRPHPLHPPPGRQEMVCSPCAHLSSPSSLSACIATECLELREDTMRHPSSLSLSSTYDFPWTRFTCPFLRVCPHYSERPLVPAPKISILSLMRYSLYTPT